MPSAPDTDLDPRVSYDHQPAWALTPSDSLQYELFFGDRFLSVRALSFPSCQFISAWMFDGGVVDLCASYEPLTNTHPGRPGLHAHNQHFSFELGQGGGQIRIFSPEHGDFDVVFEETFSTLWRVPLGDLVIHQPLLKATLVHGGESWTGTGYAKRYTFEAETQHTYWRFITGPVAEGPEASWLWTAEAAFDLAKYDYFKLALANGGVLTADQPGSWHRDRMAYGMINGAAHHVEIEDLGRIERLVSGPGTNLKLSQAFCRMILTAGEDEHRSFALNEVACGSHC